MRRLLAAAAIGAVVLTGAGCSNSGTPAATGTSAAPATSAAPTGGNTQEICDSINAAGEQLKTGMAGMAVLMGEKDPAKVTAALKDLATAITAFGTDIQTKAANATDPQFKAALDQAKTAMDSTATKLADPALQKEPSKALDILADPQVSKAVEDLAKFCPGIA